MRLHIDADRVKAERLNKGIKSEAQLPRQIGIGKIYLNGVMRGRQNATRQIIEGICCQLDLQPKDFLSYK